MLRDLSGNVARQLSELEEKLVTLADGTEGGFSALTLLSRSFSLLEGHARKLRKSLTSAPYSCCRGAIKLADYSPDDSFGFKYVYPVTLLPRGMKLWG
jgi:hypothetical protein